MSALHPDVIKLVKEAIRLEIKGRAFFVHAAEMTESDLGKKTFERLANDEVEHMKAFGRLFTEVTGDETQAEGTGESEEDKPLSRTDWSEYGLTEDEAKDVTQDVWLNVVRKIGAVRDPAAFPAWLYKVAHTHVVSHFRKTSFDPLPENGTRFPRAV